MTADLSQQVQGLLGGGQFEQARCLAERMTRENPSDSHAWLLLGSVLVALGRPVMAAEPFRQAWTLKPGDTAIADKFCQVLIQAGLRLESLAQYDSAEASYREAIAINAHAVPARLNLGRLLSASGRYEDARTLLSDVLAAYPGQPDACAALALTYEYEGDYTQAAGLLREPLQQSPIAPPVAFAYGVLARHIGEVPQAIELLEALLGGSLPESAARDLHFALGDLYDAAREYDRAFEHYRLGNRLLDYRYDPAQTQANFRAIAKSFSRERHPRLARSELVSARPVFIVGMPRSGTTLVEQILASHPEVFGAGERDDIARIVHALGGPAPAPAAIERITGGDLAKLAQGYLDTLSRLSHDAQRVTDKMPHNFMALGYIDLLFPDCRIVHCVRDPRDTCLSIWFRQMTGNHPYTADLDALADYYRQYSVLMAHWKSVIRAPVLDVGYESLVADIERGARELVAFCGLDWSDECLRFYENARVVTTPTYNDVREPVHGRSVGRWRHYERHLAALAGFADKQR